MKTYLSIVLLFTNLIVVSQNTNSYASVPETTEVNHEVVDTFNVSGNCGMCKRNIEGSINKLSGVSNANWDVDSKTIVVGYDPHVISLETIKAKIANAGYDTDTVKAKKESYKGLPGCCKYDREE